MMSEGDRNETRIGALEQIMAAHVVRFESICEKQMDHENRLREIEKLAPALRVVMWVGSVLGVSIIAMIWSMITGQVSVTF